MENLIIGQPATHTDLRNAAEAFVEKVIAPRRQAVGVERETARARAEFARENRELGRRELQRSGFDVDRLDALAAERSRISKQLAAEAHRRAIDASAAAGERLGALGPVIPPPLIDVSLDQVTFIRSFADEGAVVDWNIAPGDNWARYKLDASGGLIGGIGTGRLSFFTLWQNPKSRVVTVMTAAQLMVNAHLSLHGDGEGIAAWTFGDSYARATVRARTTIWGMDSSSSSLVADQVLGGGSAQGGFFGGDSDSAITFNDVLSGSGVAVPKNAYVLIEVELHTDWTAVDGEIHLDAQSGSFKVALPQLALTVI